MINIYLLKNYLINVYFTESQLFSVCNFYGRLNNSEAKEIVAMSYYSFFLDLT